ncbi:hypothetical protein AAG570_008561 [Ranatra chinensis]|uniref:Uncharacterized protein n=1 Tax=Ranatra chinensis TaxID=642074 RepID=A0ABD0YR88_9HEMI
MVGCCVGSAEDACPCPQDTLQSSAASRPRRSLFAGTALVRHWYRPYSPSPIVFAYLCLYCESVHRSTVDFPSHSLNIKVLKRLLGVSGFRKPHWIWSDIWGPKLAELVEFCFDSKVHCSALVPAWEGPIPINLCISETEEWCERNVGLKLAEFRLAGVQYRQKGAVGEPPTFSKNAKEVTDSFGYRTFRSKKFRLS